jgi:hypothetical protein
VTVPSAPPADAYAIFQRARSAVSNAAYPRRLDYAVAISGYDGDRFRENHYRASYDANDGAIRELPISDEELASPSAPHGVNVRFVVGLYGFAYVIPLGPPPPSADVIGVPLLSPAYAFGLQLPQARTLPQPDSPATDLRTIAVVSTRTRDYAVTLLDAPLLEGIQTYHLQLTPLRKPKANRLRELWVGTGDYLPRRAVVSGNFTTAPLTDVPWTISFATFEGAPVIASETAAAALYLPHRRVVRDASIAFVNVHEPSGTPIGEPLVEPQVEDGALLEPPL